MWESGQAKAYAAKLEKKHGKRKAMEAQYLITSTISELSIVSSEFQNFVVITFYSFLVKKSLSISRSFSLNLTVTGLPDNSAYFVLTPQNHSPNFLAAWK